MFTISRSRLRQCGTALAVVMMLSAFADVQAIAQERTYEFNIPAEDIARALNDFSRQTGIQILFPYDVAAGHSAPAISGKFTSEEVLSKLLEGSGLQIAARTERSITLRPAESGSATRLDADGTTEVIVTGTHIRGGNPTSPVHTVTRSDILQSGYSQVGDVIRSLPENFSGGQNPGVIAASGTGNSGNANATNASTVNLRGLGTDATLVLLNGHRIAADSLYQAGDISGIPLQAIQRIEVVPDGASALYGSDAVAGVVNFVLRKDFNGGSLSARAGVSSQGGGTERTFNIVQGGAGADGYLLGTFEVSNQDAIMADDRKFTSGMAPGNTLIQPQTRRSLLVSGGRKLSDSVSMSVDALVYDRQVRSETQMSGSQLPYQNTSYNPAYSVAAVFDVELPASWNLHVNAVASGSRNSIWYLPAGGVRTVTGYGNHTQYIEANADGALFQLPSGPVKAALGVGFRNEGYENGELRPSRDVTYIYGEAISPIVTPSSSRDGLNELEFSVAVRSEAYSDFGTATSPRLGIRYVPLPGVVMRGSWSESFKAPSFIQMYSSTIAVLYDAAWLGGPAGKAALRVQGGNPDLKPETSRSWTMGVDYNPPKLKSLKLSATYFDIEYSDRVVNPIGSFSTGLSDPIYAPFVDRNPTATSQANLISSSAPFYNFSGMAYDPASVVAIMRNNYQNATAQKVKGVDLSYRQQFQLANSNLAVFANGTWLTLDQQTISTQAPIEISGTIFNVPDFKARGGITWSGDRLSSSAIINYVSGEIDNGVQPNVDVASWTTVDANFVYKLPARSDFLQGASLTLSISNLFDKKPPRVVSPSLSYQGIFYDSTNASIIGRFVSLTVSKAW